MKPTLWSLAVVCALGASAVAKPEAKPKEEKSEGEQHADLTRAALIGQRAPAATLPLLDGGKVALGELIGKKPLYLKFWATWCKPCRAQMPHFARAYRKYGDRLGVYAIDLGVNDPIETVRAFVAEQKLPMPVAIDAEGDLAERFHVAVTPLHILIDRSGVVRYIGHETNAALEQALEAVANNTALPAVTAATPPATTNALALRDGSAFTLATGKPVVLSFVTAWCDGYLKDTRPAMAAACAAHGKQIAAQQRGHAGLAWVTVVHPVWTGAEDLDGYVKRFGVSRRIGLDAQAAWFERYKVRDTPTTILIDASGVEVARVTGNGDDLAAAIAKLK